MPFDIANFPRDFPGDFPGGYPGDAYTAGVAAALKEKFGIDHATIQIETDPGTPCVLESDKTV